MKSRISFVLVSMLLAAITIPASADVVYTQVNVSIPINGYYNLDLNRGGVVNFTLRSAFLQGYCQSGDEYLWGFDVIPGNEAGVMTPPTPGVAYASALRRGVMVGPYDNFYSGTAIMGELFWGACSTGSEGYWLGLSDRYLGLYVVGPDTQIHYGWAKVSTAAYVDEDGHLHATAFLSGFAYETVPGQPILTGQMQD